MRTSRLFSPRAFASAVLLAGLMTGTWLTWRHRSAQRRADDTARAQAERQTAAAARAIDTLLASVMRTTRAIADSLSGGSLRAVDLQGSAAAALRRTPSLSGVGVAYEPFAYAPSVRLFAPYYVRVEGHAPREERLDRSLDYSNFQYASYRDPILEGAMWTEPHLADPKLGLLAAFAVPFFRSREQEENQAPVGIVFSGVAMERIEAVIAALGSGRLGYGYLLSKEGRYLSHPRADFAASGRTIFETAWTARDTALNSMAIRALKGDQGHVERFDEISGQSSWTFYTPVPSAGWTLAVVYIRNGAGSDATGTRRDLMQITGAYLLAALGLIAWLLLSWARRSSGAEGPEDPVRHTPLWIGALATGALFTAGIGLLWAISDRYPSRADASRVPVTDRSTLERVLRQRTRDAMVAQATAPVYVPTGVYLNAIQFLDAYELKVSGTVWQRYDAATTDALTRGFILSQAVSIETHELYRRREIGAEHVAWTFVATLRQDFDYVRYPFDRQEVWVRLRHADAQRNVLLVPDLDAYALTNPAAKPGVDAEMVLPGWTVLDSFFDFHEHLLNADFGLPRLRAQQAESELSFNVTLQRKFLEPFVSRVLPLAVVVVLLFAILSTASMRRTDGGALGFSAMSSISGCAALFFVVTFQHISLHEAIGSPRIAYFEYFYFATYLVLMVVCVNAILFAANARLRLFDYGDNLVPKLAYWPVYVGTLLVITAGFFY